MLSGWQYYGPSSLKVWWCWLCMCSTSRVVLIVHLIRVIVMKPSTYCTVLVLFSWLKLFGERQSEEGLSAHLQILRDSTTKSLVFLIYCACFVGWQPVCVVRQPPTRLDIIWKYFKCSTNLGRVLVKSKLWLKHKLAYSNPGMAVTTETILVHFQDPFK